MKRTDEIRTRAYELARSGTHPDRVTVRSALEREGYAEARFVLDDPIAGAHVAALCGEHWQGRTACPSQPQGRLNQSRTSLPGARGGTAAQYTRVR